jgi:hypothetical protein
MSDRATTQPLSETAEVFMFLFDASSFHTPLSRLRGTSESRLASLKRLNEIQEGALHSNRLCKTRFPAVSAAGLLINQRSPHATMVKLARHRCGTRASPKRCHAKQCCLVLSLSCGKPRGAGSHS